GDAPGGGGVRAEGRDPDDVRPRRVRVRGDQGGRGRVPAQGRGPGPGDRGDQGGALGGRGGGAEHDEAAAGPVRGAPPGRRAEGERRPGGAHGPGGGGAPARRAGDVERGERGAAVRLRGDREDAHGTNPDEAEPSRQGPGGRVRVRDRSGEKRPKRRLRVTAWLLYGDFLPTG